MASGKQCTWQIHSKEQLDIFMFWWSINILFFKASFFLNPISPPPKKSKNHTIYSVIDHPCISIICIPDLNKSLLCIHRLILWWLCFSTFWNVTFNLKLYIISLSFLYFFFQFLLGWTRDNWNVQLIQK